MAWIFFLNKRFTFLALPAAPPPPPPGLELPNNPGTIEELHKKTQNVFPMFFDGAKILVNKGLNSHFQVSHTLTLAKQSPGYRFGATYVGTKMLSPSEVGFHFLNIRNLKYKLRFVSRVVS